MLVVGGQLICDQTGLGKTILFLANYYYSKAHIETDAEGKPTYKIMVLVAPAGVLKQWADEIIDKWPGLRLMISYDDTGLTASKYETPNRLPFHTTVTQTSVGLSLIVRNPNGL